jgi:predicted transcriptional regulator
MQWDVMDGREVNGAGEGFFLYTIPIPEGIDSQAIQEAFFLVEVSAKEYFIKDQKEYETDQDFMLGSQVASSANPNSYPMTDEKLHPSKISISINGQKVYTTTLADDPADHRGVLSWHHQLQDKKLREAGSYGYLIKVPIEKDLLQNALQEGELLVLLQTEGEGGIAVYGKEFGRYALDPSLVLKK